MKSRFSSLLLPHSTLFQSRSLLFQMWQHLLDVDPSNVFRRLQRELEPFPSFLPTLLSSNCLMASWSVLQSLETTHGHLQLLSKLDFDVWGHFSG